MRKVSLAGNPPAGECAPNRLESPQMQLTREQIAQFDRDGYLVIEDLLTADQVALLQGETAQYHETLAGAIPADVDVTWEPKTNPPRVQQVLNAELLSTTLAGIIRSQQLRDLI